MAYFEGKLTLDETQRVLAHRDEVVQSTKRPLRVGEAAVALTVLSAGDVETILASQKTMVDSGRTCADVITLLRGNVSESHSAIPFALRRTVLLRFLAVFLAIVAFVLSHRVFRLTLPSSLSWVAATLAVSRQLILYVCDVLPNKSITRFAKLSRLLVLITNAIAWVVAITCFTLLVGYALSATSIIASSESDQQRHFIFMGMGLALSLGWLSLNMVWRRSEIIWNKRRDRLHVDLLQASFGFMRGGTSGDIRGEAAAELLARIGAALNTNPLDQLLMRTIWSARWTRYSLWYLEPMEPTNGKVVRFRVVAVAAPDAKEHVTTHLDQVRQIYQARWDQSRVDDVVKNFQRADGRIPEELRTINGRKEFLSLTGWVYSTGRGTVEQRGDRNAWLTDEHRTVLGDVSDPDLLAYLAGASFASFPVEKIDGTKLGVLIALRARQNGITPEDQVTLLNGAKMLGIALAS